MLSYNLDMNFKINYLKMYMRYFLNYFGHQKEQTLFLLYNSCRHQETVHLKGVGLLNYLKTKVKG